MLKKRLIFTLLWDAGAYWLSRNFRLQRAGDLAWIEQHYNFKVIASAIDELIVLNVGREVRDTALFAEDLIELSRGCFVPIAAGGGVRSVDDARALLRSGADKLVINTPIFESPELVDELVRACGSQCIVASIDYRSTSAGLRAVTHNGTVVTNASPREAAARAEELGVGEIYLTCMDKDGTGQGYDLETLVECARASVVPIIASGGVGSFQHLAEWLSAPDGMAASTANIFNFLGGGLLEARKHLTETGVALARWNTEWKPE